MWFAVLSCIVYIPAAYMGYALVRKKATVI
jgi:hypothetical protein